MSNLNDTNTECVQLSRKNNLLWYNHFHPNWWIYGDLWQAV